MLRKPPVWVLTEDEAVCFANEYLSGRHSTLWGRSFDIINHTTRNEAIDFLVQLVKELGFVEILDDPLIRAEDI